MLSVFRGFAAGLCVGAAAYVPLCAEVSVYAGETLGLPVYVAADAAADERAAAKELARVLGAMSGRVWPVLDESAAGAAAAPGFYVGRTRAALCALPALKRAGDLLAPAAGEVGPDGFRIQSVGSRIYVEGATPEATPYAVAWLLQRYGGVRWYAPGPLGEVIPRRASWVLPDLSVVREPAYVSREITGLYDAAGHAWARRNGLRQRLEFSHNLLSVFTPEVYDAHPEWFASVRGERRRPQGNGDYRWQPDLSRDDVAEFAAAQAAESFVRDPDRASFSLGMNDSVRFDQGQGTRRLVEPLRFFRGMPDYSPLVFTFINRAAAELGRLRPERRGEYLGCLAYFWCEAVPPFPVDARVVPYVTTDRTQFYDPEYRAADYALMSRWCGSGVRAFGLWEYGYGSAFVVPRVPHAMLAEAVREGWRRGARGYIADTGPHAGFDAFKVWMLAQLLWDPERPLDALKNDFFGGWYGPAAPAMRRFFDRCEQAWMAQSGPPWWIKFYQQQDQVLIYSPELCTELRALLTEAEEKARVPEGAASGALYSARVELTSRAFAVTEAAVAFDHLRRELTAPEARELTAAELGRRLVAWQRARLRLVESVQEATSGEVPALASGNIGFLLRNDPVSGLLVELGRRERAAPAEALSALPAAGMEAPAHWAALAAALGGARLSPAGDLAVNGTFSQVAPRGLEPRFLHPLSGALPCDWNMRAVPTELGRVALVTAVEPGARALRIEGAWDTRVTQALHARPGRLHVAEIQMRGRSSPGGDAALMLEFIDAAGNLVGEYRAAMLPKGESDWRTLVLADVAPATAKYVVFGVTAERQFGGDWLEAMRATLQVVE